MRQWRSQTKTYDEAAIMVRAEGGPTTEVWGRSPQRGPRAEPSVEAEILLALNHPSVA